MKMKIAVAESMACWRPVSYNGCHNDLYAPPLPPLQQLANFTLMGLP
jgi:hypothetical protein